MPVLTLDQIESLCFDALKRAGASDEQATIVAEEIMDAEAEGIRRPGCHYFMGHESSRLIPLKNRLFGNTPR